MQILASVGDFRYPMRHILIAAAVVGIGGGVEQFGLGRVNPVFRKFSRNFEHAFGQVTHG